MTSQTEATKAGKLAEEENKIALKTTWERVAKQAQATLEEARRERAKAKARRESRRKRTSEGHRGREGQSGIEATDGVRPGGDDEGPESERGVLGGISSRCEGPSSSPMLRVE